jgi:hypothetical protein
MLALARMRFCAKRDTSRIGCCTAISHDGQKLVSETASAAFAAITGTEAQPLFRGATPE